MLEAIDNFNARVERAVLQTAAQVLNQSSGCDPTLDLWVAFLVFEFHPDCRFSTLPNLAVTRAIKKVRKALGPLKLGN